MTLTRPSGSYGLTGSAPLYKGAWPNRDTHHLVAVETWLTFNWLQRRGEGEREREGEYEGEGEGEGEEGGRGRGRRKEGIWSFRSH